MPLPEIELSKLKPYKQNPRRHPKRQLRQLAESMRTFGFIGAVVVDKDDTILAGHARVDAAKILGLTCVPYVRVEHLTPEQKRAFVLADNKLTLNAVWDEQLLAQELEALLTSTSTSPVFLSPRSTL